MHHHKASLTLFCAAALLTTACDDTTGEPEPGADDGVVWSTQVAPIISENCAACHTEGGSAPFALDTHADMKLYGELAVESMEAGRMPPWSPDPDCRPIEGERVMDPDDIALVRQWLEDGSLEGPEADPIAPQTVAFEPTHEAKVGSPYTPVLGESDDYRCFLLDMDFDQDMYLQATNVVPGNALVHHVLVYALTGDQAEAARASDAEDETVGYTCFGGPVDFGGMGEGGGMASFAALGDVRFPNQIGAWVPGQSPRDNGDAAIRIEQGSQIVMQVHYSAVAGEPIADSETAFQGVLTAEPPELLMRTTPIAQLELDIPAGEADVQASITLPYYSDTPLDIAGATGHMHLLGKSIKATVTRADGGEVCAMDIPDWDFEWQESYTFPAGEHLVLKDGDSITLDCAYDNSMANQPVVNGVQQDPRDVEWGDGTLDEMCLLYLSTVEPYSTAPATSEAACSAECAAECGADAGCLAKCDDGFGCPGCVIGQVFECQPQACLGPVLGIRECLRPCILSSLMLGGNFGECMEAECGANYAAALTCLDDALGSDECAQAPAACGL
jgi:mono/diheme cytochrome c family protein